MAIKPISYYGQFTPTGVDQSGAKRMQALAGLAEQVGGMAEQFGIDKAEKETPAVAAQALQESITVDEAGQKVYGEIPTFKGWDAKRRNALAIAGYTASLENDVTNIVDSAKLNNPTNTTEYNNVVTAAMKGLKTNLPENAKGLVESYFNQINRTAFQGIQEEEIKINNDIALGNIETAITNSDTNILTLAGEGRSLDLIQAIVNKDAKAQLAIKAGILNPVEYAKNNLILNAKIVEQFALNPFNKILQNNEINENDRISEASNKLQELKAQTRVSIPNPINPEENITLSPEEKQKLESNVASRISSLKTTYAWDKKQEEISEATAYKQNINEWDFNNLSSSNKDENGNFIIPIKQMKTNLIQLTIDGKITPTSANLREKLLTSISSLNATDDDYVIGGLVQSMYSTIQIKDPVEYQTAMLQITDRIIQEQNQGNITNDRADEIRNQFTYLTAPSNAKSLKRLTRTAEFRGISNLIDTQIPVAYRPQVLQEIFFEVFPQIQRQEEETGNELNNSEQAQIYKRVGQQIINKRNLEADIQAAQIISGEINKKYNFPVIYNIEELKEKVEIGNQFYTPEGLAKGQVLTRTK